MFKVEIKAKESTWTILAKEFSTLAEAEMWVNKYKHLPQDLFPRNERRGGSRIITNGIES